MQEVLPLGIKAVRDTHSGCPRYHLRNEIPYQRNNPLGQSFTSLGLAVKSPQRFIPEQYLLGSISQRWELLKGLMDTDGSCVNNRTTYSTMSPQLAKDISELIRSLGGMAIIHKYDRGEKGIEYAVNVRVNRRPFKLDRKGNHWKATKKNPPKKGIISIEKTGKAEQVCIRVEAADSLFLVKDFIVTHNSFIVKHLIRLTAKHADMCAYILGEDASNQPIYLSSTTNKAAEVLTDATEIQASTIHKLLGLVPVTNYKTGEQSLIQKNAPMLTTDTGIIFIDEASMLDTKLLGIVRKHTTKFKKVYIGDAYQLPPVIDKKSPVFDTEVIPDQYTLTTIHRQAKGSSIIDLASSFREALDTGVLPNKLISSGPEVEILSDTDFKDALIESFTKYSPDTCKAIAWKNITIRSYNRFIRKHLFGYDDSPREDEYYSVNSPIKHARKEQILVGGNKTVQVSNIQRGIHKDLTGYWVTLNGNDTLRVFYPEDFNQVKVAMREAKKAKDWREFYALKDTLADLRMPYASTTHKSQGSTYHTVLIDVGDIYNGHDKEIITRLMYTSITRASHKVILRGL